MANLAVTLNKAVIGTTQETAVRTGYFIRKISCGCPAASIRSNGINTVITQNSGNHIAGFISSAKRQWNKFKNYISDIVCSQKFPKTLTKEDCNVIRLPDDNVSKVLKSTIGEKKYRIATSGYSFNTEGYEEPTEAFLKSIDCSLGSQNTGYILPPTLDKGSIYDITAQISGLRKDKSLFVTAEEFFNKYLNPENFSANINIREYMRAPIHVFPTQELYTSATANASNVLVCTGGRNIAIKEIVEAIKRKNKIVLLLNLNLKNGTYNKNVNEVENAARYFDELRLSGLSKYSREEKREIEDILKNKNIINRLVRVYLVNDVKSATEAGKRAAKFIQSTEPNVIQQFALPDINEVKNMSITQLRELARFPEGIALMKKAGIITRFSERKEIQSVYGQIRYKQIKSSDGDVISSTLLVPELNGKTKNILKNIPQGILQSPVTEHIHKINWSTINPEVGITVTQNQSKPIIARKIVTGGTLENSLVQNNSHNIPLRYDMVKGVQYIETPLNSSRQVLTGDGFMVLYSSPVNSGNILRSAKKISEDRSFMPADIAGKQYEIISGSGRVPCDFEKMVAGVDYKISKKAGVELKMAVPPREVISSEGQILPAGKLYMVDSNGHFYDGNPILRIKNGEISWNADTNDPVQKHIKYCINESLKLEAEAEKTTDKELKNKLYKQAKILTSKAEKEMTDWVRIAQNKNKVNFFI